MARESIDALVIGGGPAGLMAAETLAAAGRRGRPRRGEADGRAQAPDGRQVRAQPDRRTRPPEAFAAAYTEGGDWLAPILAGFGPAEVRGLGRGARRRGLHRQLRPGLSRAR